MKYIAKPNPKVKFVDCLFCDGGCIGGPHTNKKLSIKTVKPRIFAQVANKANVNFEKLLNVIMKEINGKINNSNKKEN